MPASDPSGAGTSAVVTAAEVVRKLKEAGLSAADVSQMRAWADYVVNESEIAAQLAVKTLSEEYRAQMLQNLHRAINSPADRMTIKQALAMADDAARKQAATLVKGLTETQVRQMGETIARGLRNGLHPHEIAEQLEMVNRLDSNRAQQLMKYNEWLQTKRLDPSKIETMTRAMEENLLQERRKVVAATEARYATSEARIQAASARGAQRKLWVTEGGPRVCDVCEENQAIGPIPLDVMFPGGTGQPPAHPGCRCSLAFGTSDAMILDLEEMAKEMAQVTRDAKKAASTAEKRKEGAA